MARRRRRKNRGGSIVISIIIIICALLGLLYNQSDVVRDFVDGLGIFGETPSINNPYIDPDGTEMAVHFIDVGQGDCTLLQTPEGSVLIDCGERGDDDEILAYLKSQGVTSLEYVIFTHPHEDHMGCAPELLEGIEVKNVIMNDRVSTAKFFEKTIEVLESKNINTIPAIPGEVYTVGALRLTILGPYSKEFAHEDTNNSSVIVHASYGHRAFLFTGDAEALAEEELLSHHKNDIKCDVFSAGHHGSSSSNTLALVQAASPSYAVISCGKNNSYGHPNTETITTFDKCGVTYYRTDELGTIVFVTDGKTLTKK